MNVLKTIKRSKRKLLSTNFSFKSKITINEEKNASNIEDRREEENERWWWTMNADTVGIKSKFIKIKYQNDMFYHKKT